MLRFGIMMGRIGRTPTITVALHHNPKLTPPNSRFIQASMAQKGVEGIAWVKLSSDGSCSLQVYPGLNGSGGSGRDDWINLILGFQKGQYLATSLQPFNHWLWKL
ncbi:hypothetical protein REPUB_Repub12eG0004400 [Reevesia pubescens]